MRLVSFSVTNYRSVSKAYKIELNNKTILIGKNNEGKSNLLKALDLSMEVLKRHSMDRYSKANRLTDFDWLRDFPIQYQVRKSGLQSIFRLQFELNENELDEFYSQIKSRINGFITIEIKIGKDNKPDISVPKKGKYSFVLTKKSLQIAKFISQRVEFNYIPTIRTEDQVIRIIQDSLFQELLRIEENQDYQVAISTITRLQTKVLDDIAEQIKTPLIKFLPSIKNIKIEILEEKRKIALKKSIDVIVDDGVPTSIEFKGDGIKSLAAIAMLKDRKNRDISSILAIEEPESHLHPSAIHQLNNIFNDLSESSQIIISTHNAIFVERNNIKSNIIVNSGKANSANKIKDIRDILGIKASDNLINASFVLVVEGENDKILLNNILGNESLIIEKAMKNNIFIIEEIGGASNLLYKLSNLRNTICTYHVLLDNDAAGRSAFEAAKVDQLLDIKNVTLTNCIGMQDSEFEDCLQISEYSDFILTTYGVDIQLKSKNPKDKWSYRMKDLFQRQGKPWSEKIEKELKSKIAYHFASKGKINLSIHHRTFIDSLVKSLEQMIKFNELG